ncbi:MAG: BTAD domain-containing putative transcriptional regulator [Actinomycetota bacterium]|nr:BTAD domain-containing putative transcriptional regulator [Actinomycetota bacterium]
MATNLAVLGPLDLRVDGATIALRPAQRRLLSILALDAPREISTESLVERMWPDGPPATARTALQVHISGIRQTVPNSIVTTEWGYRNDTAAVQIDVDDFEQHCSGAARYVRDLEWQRAEASATSALSLWRGSPFAELSDDEFAVPEITRLDERMLATREIGIEALMAQGHSRDVLPELQTLVSEHPLREGFRYQLMLALYRVGRQAEALRTYQDIRQRLGEELGIEPSPTLRELEEHILFQDQSIGRLASQASPTNLPRATTSFVGRESEIDDVAVRLSEHRMATIVGGPGFGKTRLATEVGRTVLSEHEGGVWFVTLSGTTTDLEVAAEIATTTGVRAEIRSMEDLAAILSRRRALLILDNCEHVIDPCRAFVEAALSEGDELEVMATSRRPLGLPGEQVVRLGPLEATDDHGSSGEAFTSPTVQLFLDRAHAVDRTFTLTDQPIGSVIALTDRLAGIPLGIELAARWVAALTIDEIAAMLRDSDGDGGSLGSAISWSLGLLASDDRDLLLRTAVFAGSFTLLDAHAICGPGRARAQFSAAMARLVDASLLAIERHGADIRYRTLAPIREFLLSVGHDEWEQVSSEHARHFLEKVSRSQEDLYTVTLDLETTHSNMADIRTSLDYALAHGWNDEAARALSRVSYYFHQRYLHWESQAWLDRVLERDISPEVRGYALRALGSGAQILGHQSKAATAFEEAIALFDGLNAQDRATRCLMSLAGVYSDRGDWDLGLEAAERAYSQVADGPNPSAVGISTYYIGENLYRRGDIREALPHLMKSASIFRETGENGRAAFITGQVARAAFHANDQALASDSAADAQELAGRANSDFARTTALGARALTEATWGDPHIAALLLVEVEEQIVPGHPDEIYDLLLPAAATMAATEEWNLVGGIVRSVEAHVAETENAIPRPWADAMAEWAEAATLHGVSSTPGLRIPPLSDIRRDAHIRLRSIGETVETNA